MLTKLFPKFVLIAYGAILATPGIVFVLNRGGLGAIFSQKGQDLAVTIYPLLGLYALTLVWAQLIIGANRRWLRNWFNYATLIRYHAFQGVGALIFALTHPLFLVYGVGLANYSKFNFIAENQLFWLGVGVVSHFLLIITISAALLRKKTWMQPLWRHIHRANYVIFWGAWMHSWFLGSDLQAGALRWLWLFYAATGAVSVLNYTRSRLPASAKNA